MSFKTLLTKSWSYLWKSPYLWLFVAAYNLPGMILSLLKSGTILFVFLGLLASLFSLLVVLIGTAGIIQTIYLLFKNEKPSLENTWAPVWQNLGRVFWVVILSIPLAFLLAFACLLLTGLVFRLFTGSGVQREPGLYLMMTYITIFDSGLVILFSCDVLIKGYGVWASIRHGLSVALKKSNFGRLIALGVFFIGILPLILPVAEFGIMWFQSGLSPAFISAAGYQSFLAVSYQMPYWIVSMAMLWIIHPWYFSALTLAYLDFTGESQTIGSQPPLPASG